MNDNNIKGVNESRTPNERKESARKAGRASGEARRKRKTLRQVFDALLASKEPDPNDNTRKITGAEYLGLSLYRKAAAGNVRAFQLIAEITGEYKQAIEIEQKPQREGMSIQEAHEMLADLEKDI